MQVAAIDAGRIYRAITIETDSTGEHWVADKTGENVRLSRRFKSFAAAQREWSRRVEKFLK
jgi:hypothetical protein